MKSTYMGKDHCKKLKRERWFQLEDSTKRKNGATPQHRVRYGQIRPVALGILHYANRVREIIDGNIQWMGTRKAYSDNTG